MQQKESGIGLLDTGHEDFTETRSPITDIRSEATPSMQQFLETKMQHPDELLFFQMGDFFEMFFDDAVKASAILDIALTKRGRHKGDEIPMCGVPVATVDFYLERLIRAGVRVAVCRQLETPEEAKKRGSKAVIKREVTRIVTPGTITEENILSARQSSYICSIAIGSNTASIARADLTTGSFTVSSTSIENLLSELFRIAPKEVIVPENLRGTETFKNIFTEFSKCLTFRQDTDFAYEKASRSLRSFYQTAANEVLGLEEKSEISASGALISYLLLTQVQNTPRLEKPVREADSSIMLIDAATRRNLELTSSLDGSRDKSLLDNIDFTLTAGGSRLLSERLSSPLTFPAKINERLDSIQFFTSEKPLREKIRNTLKSFPDLERSIGKICLDRAAPRDLGAVQAALSCIKSLRMALEGKPLPAELSAALSKLSHHEELRLELANALSPELPVNIASGNFIRNGYSAILDEFRALRDDGKKLLMLLQAKYQQATGISGLKIKHNNILGHFIEITAINQDKITADFVHRQTMAGAMRYTTVELKETESKVTGAAAKAEETERAIFVELAGRIKAAANELTEAARAVSVIDVASSNADIAESRKFCRPAVDDSLRLEIKNGRHPVVETGLKKLENKTFSANSCDLLEDGNLWLLTGPNMAGKSTFLRQNALIAIMAQSGFYVPAEAAHIGVVDRLFSRVGASDDLARGRSTFMVEMVETATILNQSTERSLVILDEIGRGTATYDGLSIAWATIEHIHNKIKCRALFATHYHELTALSTRLSRLRCHTMKVKEWKGEVIFLHEVVPGIADRSYGIHVAELAGLPEPVIKRAEEILKSLEENRKASPAAMIEELPLFAGYGLRHTGHEKEITKTESHTPNPALEKLKSLNPDELSPKEAHQLLYSLKELAENKG